MHDDKPCLRGSPATARQDHQVHRASQIMPIRLIRANLDRSSAHSHFPLMFRALARTFMRRRRPTNCGGADAFVRVRWRAICGRMRLLLTSSSCGWGMGRDIWRRHDGPLTALLLHICLLRPFDAYVQLVELLLVHSRRGVHHWIKAVAGLGEGDYFSDVVVVR